MRLLIKIRLDAAAADDGALQVALASLLDELKPEAAYLVFEEHPADTKRRGPAAGGPS